jgi:hypothetical protein
MVNPVHHKIGAGTRSFRGHEPVSNIDTAVVDIVDSLKALDSNRPIREADINYRHGARSRETIEELMQG